MALSLISRLEETTEKLSRLAVKYQQLRERVAELEEERTEQDAENTRLRQSLDKARADVEFLTMSHRLASDPDSLLAARRKVAAMIREIDRCISQLKE